MKFLVHLYEGLTVDSWRLTDFIANTLINCILGNNCQPSTVNRQPFNH